VNRREQKENVSVWFRPEDYTCVTEFNFEDWYHALSYRRMFKELFESDYGDHFTSGVKWHMFNKRRVPSHDNLRYYVPDEADGISSEAFTPIEELDIRENPEAAKHYAENGWVILAIHPDAPDTEIEKNFERWKRNFRRKHPLPTLRQGRQHFNIEVTLQHTARWARHHVLECFDINFWSKIHGTTPISEQSLYELISSNDLPDHGDWVRSARRNVDEAINCTHLISYRV